MKNINFDLTYKMNVTLSGSLVLLLAVLCACSGDHSVDSRPNILLITLDTTRADRLGCYGYPRHTTPRIDAVAKDGVLFDFAIAQASITPVSHASILTGLYPYQHGLRVIHGASMCRLEEGVHPTLATILQESGWKTAAFVSAFTVSEHFGLHYGFDLFDHGLTGDLEEKMIVTKAGRARWEVDKNQRRADQTTLQALNWLEKNEEGPFFLWLHYFDPHDLRLKPPQEDCDSYINKNAKYEDERQDMYDAEVAFMDQQLGKVFDLLREKSLYENTVIVITNDHGQGLGDHDWWNHRILYQEQIRMPLIMRLPHGPSGLVVSDLVRGIDIMPTLVECAGLPVPNVEGKSLMGLIRGEAESSRTAYADALISLDDNRPYHAQGKYEDLMYCVMNRSWKLIFRRFNTDESELYKIDEDPKELENVINKYPEIRDSLLEFLKKPGVMIDELIQAAPQTEELDRLRELGY
ncbi:MAG: sulfatase [Planctomycetes bacterium]|nr:sulfatase [Planctomycetota bacterium]